VTPAFAEAPDQVTVLAWRDPLVERLGHRPGSPYVEAVWLGVLGPSTTLAWARLARVAATVERASVDVTDLSVSLGLGESLGRNATITRTLNRMASFGAAHRTGDTLAVRLALPDLPERAVGRLSLSARLAHEHLAHQRRTPTADAVPVPSLGVQL